MADLKSPDATVNPESVGVLAPVGRLAGPRGARGQIWAEPYGDGFPPIPGGSLLWLALPGGPRAFEVVEFFPHKGRFVLKLSGIADPGAASPLRGVEICMERGRIDPDPPGTFEVGEVLGFAVRDVRRGEVGLVEGVAEGPAYWYFLVSGPLGPFEVPAVRGLSVEVDLGARSVKVDLPEGWPGLDEPAGKVGGPIPESPKEGP